MKFKTRLSLISAFCFLLISCYKYIRPSNIKFDKKQWSSGGDGIVYPNRDRMLDDLLENYKLEGLIYNQLIETLGKEPDYNNIYEIVVYYNNDIDPRYVKVLKFTLNKDSTVISWKLIENPSNY